MGRGGGAGANAAEGSDRIQKSKTMEIDLVPACGPARPGRDARRDRHDPRPGRLSAAEEGDPVHGRDRTTVAPRTGAEAARAAPGGGGRPGVGRGVVARPGADPGP